MKKIIFILLFCFISIFSLRADASTAASIDTAIYQDWQIAKYGDRVNAPLDYTMDSISVNGFNGAVQLRENDYVFPGKNGMDVVIAREYDSSAEDKMYYYAGSSSAVITSIDVYEMKYINGSNAYLIYFMSEDEIFENEENGGLYIDTSKYKTSGGNLVTKNLYQNLAASESSGTFVTRDTTYTSKVKYISRLNTRSDYDSTGNMYNQNWKLAQNRLYKYSRTYAGVGDKKISHYTLYTKEGTMYDLKEEYSVYNGIVNEYEVTFTYSDEYQMITDFLNKDETDLITIDPRGFSYKRAIRNKYGYTVYFDEYGTQVAEEDKYGNLITYVYEDDDIIINDTMNRQIRVSRNGENLEKVSVTMDGQTKDLVFYDYSVTSTDDTYEYDDVYSLEVTKISGNESKEEAQDKYTYTTRKRNNQYGVYGCILSPVYLLESVSYPDGSTSDFGYSQIKKNPTNKFLAIRYYLTESENNVTGNNLVITENKCEYSYPKLPSYNDNRVMIMNRGDGYQEYYGYNRWGQQLKARYSGTGLKRLEFQEYNSPYDNGAINTHTTQLFDKDNLEYIELITHYDSDDRKNITKEDSNGCITTYDYGTWETNPYNHMLSMEYEGASGNPVKVENTLTTDLKSIQKTSVYELIDGTYVEKERTEYAYDTYGNVITEKVLQEDDSYVITHYTYDYSNLPEYTVCTSVENVASADDETGSTVSTTAHFDNYGRNDYIIDGNNNRKSYTYDLLGRLLKQRDVEGEFATSFEYDVAENYVQYTTPEQTKVRQYFDAKNRTKKLQYYDKTQQQYVTLEEYTYYPDSGFTKDVITLGSHNQQYTTTYTWTYDGKILSKTIKDSQGNIVRQEQNRYDVNPDTSTDLRGNCSPVKKLYYNTNANEFGATTKTERYEIVHSGYLSVDLQGMYDYVVFDEGSSTSDVIVYADGVEVAEKEGSQEEEIDILRTFFVDIKGIKKLTISDSSGLYTYSVRGYTKEQLSQLSTTVTTTITGDSTITPVKTKTTYNLQGNILKVQQLDPTTDEIIATEEYTYDDYGRYMSSYKDAENVESNASYDTLQQTYDYAGRVISLSQYDSALSDYITTSTAYDRLGRAISQTDGSGVTVNHTYDALGRKIKTVTPVATGKESVVKYYYDGNGNLTRQATQSNAASSTTPTFDVTEFEYNKRNYMVKSTRYADDNSPNITQYYYDLTGKLLRMYTGLTSPITIDDLDEVEDGNDTQYSTYAYTYDRLGRLTQMTDPLGESETYTYDYVGNCLTKTDRDGYTVTTTYDFEGNPLSMTSSKDNKTVSYTYDALGNRKTMTDETGTTSYTYDNMSRLVSETTSTGYTKTYTYDANSNVLTFNLTDSTGNLISSSYEYDSLNRLTSVTNNDITETYTYDSNSRLTGRTTTGIAATKTYNLAGWQTKEKTTKQLTRAASTGITTIVGTYNYDGTLSAVNNLYSTADDSVVMTYTYDGMNRLISESCEADDDTINANYTNTYTFDDNSNRATLNNKSYTYDVNNRMLTDNESNTYTYTDNGNTTTDGTYIYEYDGFNRLTTLKNATDDSVIATYTYNGDGQRITKTVNGVTTTYVWNGGYIVYETTGTTDQKYYYGNTLYAYKDNIDTVYYYGYNIHGDVIEIYNGTGTAVNEYHYDSYGNRLDESQLSTDTNPFRYCGEYYDAESGLIYLRNRYYSPQTGRFITEDPIRDGLNWYVYCGNNPVNYIDPYGLDAIVITDIEGAFLQGHISGLFQDSNDIWYYYYWGNKEAFVKEITDSSAMDDLESFNNWLNDNDIYSGKYDHATYIAGDFTESLSHAISLSKNYKTDQYDLIKRNCMQTTWECIRKGTFNDGTSVGNMVKSNIGIRPNSNYESIGYIFYNTEFTHDNYWKTINDRLWQERVNYNDAWTQWSKNVLQKRINMLEKLYY